MNGISGISRRRARRTTAARRTAVAILTATAIALGLSGTVIGASDKVCTNSFHPVGLNLSYDGQGAPAPGVDEWWDMTLEGIAAEGLTVLQVAELFGLDSVDAFYEFVLAGILPVDENGNGIVCAKGWPPQQNGFPLYYFHVGDDKGG